MLRTARHVGLLSNTTGSVLREVDTLEQVHSIGTDSAIFLRCMLCGVMNANIRRSATRESELYEVSDLVIDVARQRVTRADVEVALPKLSFELLLVLIRAAPGVVSNDELMTRVWPGLVVSPETVSQRVKLLRDVLGDDPRAPRYIAGLRGRGYRLLPELRPIENVPVVPPVGSELKQTVDAGTVLRREPRRLRKSTIFGIVAGIALAAIAAFVVIALRPQPAPSPGAASVAVVGLPPRTVAVLPFENLSGDPANEYLALGIAEMVLNRLANVSELVVIARSSSFTFRDSNVDAREIGRKLDALYLVEGGVQREAERLRVTTRLIDAQNGAQLEALHFDRKLADIFTIQDEIADRMAGALEANVIVGSTTARGARSENLDAYLAYLQGRARLAKYTVSDFEAAAKNFERAIALDPQFAAAYAALAQAQSLAAWRRRGDQHQEPEVTAKAAALIEKALALDPSLGEGYIARATTVWADTDFALIEADYRKGLELDPSNGPGLVQFAEFLWRMNRIDEARRVIDRAVVVDPLSARARYVKAISFSGYESIEPQLLEVLKIDPNFVSALMWLGQLRALGEGEFAEAVMFLERAIAIDQQAPTPRFSAIMTYLDLGDPAAASDVGDASPDTAGYAQVLLLQYRGQSRAAGEAAYELAGGSGLWRVPEAVRDLALQTGDYGRAIRFIQSWYALAEPRKLTTDNVPAAVALAHLLQASGERTRSAKVLDELFAWLDRNEPRRPMLRRLRTNALALQGHRDAALAALAGDFRSGYRGGWWYTIERDPLWADMRSDPRFRAIAAEARAHAAGQRALLEEMRRKGDVPFRPARSR